MPYLDKDFKPSQYEYTNVNDYRRLLVYYPAKGGKKPSVTPTIPPVSCYDYPVYTASTLTDACNENTSLTDVFSTSPSFVAGINLVYGDCPGNPGATIVPDGIYLYQQGIPSTIYETYNGDGKIQVVVCPSPTPTPSNTPQPTPTPSITPTTTVTPTVTSTLTPTPSSVVEYHIEAQNGDIIIAQNGDNIDWFPL